MSVSMNLIPQLPQVQGYNGVMVIVDHFSKYVVLIPINIQCGTKKNADLLFKYVVKYWEIPLSIVSD